MESNNHPLASAQFNQIDYPHRLVPVTRIVGATVYDTDGAALGTISSVIADNQTGRIEYAVLAIGGFLGMGESLHPLPWDRLAHDTRRGGYLLDLDMAMLRGGPSYRSSDEPDYDRAYAGRITGYYERARSAPSETPPEEGAHGRA